jgi:hypothetical protein
MQSGITNLALSGDDHNDDGSNNQDHDTFPLLEAPPEVLERFVLSALDLGGAIARTGRRWHDTVISSGLPRAGLAGGMPFTVAEFYRSVERLAWAKANGCPWNEWTCAWIAAGGHLDVLMWAREHHCPWDEQTCA